MGNDIYEPAQHIGDQDCDEDELDIFVRAPGSFQVSPAVEKACAGDDKTSYILLDKRCCNKGPGESW